MSTGQNPPAAQVPPPKPSPQWLVELFGGRLELGAISAGWKALWGREAIDYFPRVAGPNGEPKTAPDADIIKDINEELDKIGWATIPTADLEALCIRFRESLDEAKKQTEYQDQKATGLLTTISIFGALAGLILSQMIDNYPLAGPRPIWASALIVAAYGLFALFLLLISTGAMVVFHANRTRFRYAVGSTPFRMSSPGQMPRSRLFYQQISKAQPAEWAKQIHDWQQAAAPSAPTDEVGRALRIAYLRDYVIESYLVACKTYDKIRYLMPAQTLMFWATRLFVIWILVLAALVVWVPRDKTAKSEAAKVSVEVYVAPAPTRTGGAVPPAPTVAAKALVKP